MCEWRMILQSVFRRRRVRRVNRESGSIVVLVILAIGMIVGAFLYVAVVGGRVNETLRIPTAADAAALAAATTKARSLNYASFLMMAETVLLPLSDDGETVTHCIGIEDARLGLRDVEDLMPARLALKQSA